ncbi:MAG: peptide ABC transporter substrate-binding protein [Chloroflexota bacterium]
MSGPKRAWRLCVACLVALAFAGCQMSPAGEESSSDGLYLWDTGPLTLDPAISSEMTSHSYVMHIFSGLVRLGDDLEVVPDIAESWHTSADGTQYTFELREGVKFHDGTEVTAADFKYSWERACDPATGSRTADTYLGDIVGARDMLRGRAVGISGVEVLGEDTLRVEIDAPRAYFLYKLAYPTAFVVDQENVGSGGAWWRGPNGTGPFRLAEWQPEQVLRLERNERYYAELAELEQVDFRLLAGAPMAMYEQGQIDVVPISTAYIDLARDEANPLHEELQVTPELSLHYIGFDAQQPPFDDVKVRQAFCHAVDKEKIVELVFRDMVEGAEGILPVGMPGHNEELGGLEFDAARAQELLAASDYGGASALPPVTLTTTGYGGSISGLVGAVIAEWRRNLGVEVGVRQLEPEAFLYNLKEERDQMFSLGWVADYPDPHNFLDTLFHSGRENNAFGYSNPEVDRLLDEAAVEQDEDRRLELYQQVERTIVQDAVCLPLSFGRNYVLVKPYVQGYQLSPLGIPDLTRVTKTGP